MKLGLRWMKLIVLLVMRLWLWLISLRLSLFLLRFELLVSSMFILRMLRNMLCSVVCGVRMCDM